MIQRKAVFVGAMLAGLMVTAAAAQNDPSAPAIFEAGLPLGVTTDGTFNAMSDNVKVYGALVDAESCIYDPTRNLIVVPSRGASQRAAQNDGFVALLNSDGSVHTPKWIGATRDGLVLNHPFGSDIHDGKLYLADIEGDTSDDDPRTAVLRMFDLQTGAPVGEIKAPQSPFFNDIAVADGGIVYATQTVLGHDNSPVRLYRVTPGGEVSVLVEGEPLVQPNGVAMDNDGNIVVVNMGDARVLTFSPQGVLLKTEQAAQTGSDGIVILPDGTKYVGSVRNGGISRIAPGSPAELIATGIPSAASMCYDPAERQLVVPMNPNNAVALVKVP